MNAYKFRMGSAMPYPLPWFLIPRNIYFYFCAIWYVVTDRRYKQIARYVKSQTGAELTSCDQLVMFPTPGLKILVANRPEIEIPLFIPPHLSPCGPIIRPVRSVAEVDPDLHAW